MISCVVSKVLVNGTSVLTKHLKSIKISLVQVLLIIFENLSSYTNK